jgi:type III secretion protein N (ATPase)
MSAWQEIELLVRVGEYQEGQDEEADEAMQRKEAIREFLCQSTTEKNGYEETLELLCQTLN